MPLTQAWKNLCALYTVIFNSNNNPNTNNDNNNTDMTSFAKCKLNKAKYFI